MIWTEFRAHSILFVTRSILSLNILWVSGKYKILRNYEIYLRYIIFFANLILASSITKKFQVNKNESTTNTMPYWNNCPYYFERLIKFYYTLTQF